MKGFAFCVAVLLGCLVVCEVSAKSWRRADIEGMVVFSNASEGRTEKLVMELQAAAEALRVLFPTLRGESLTALRVVVCSDTKSMSRLLPLYEGKPKRLGGLFARDWEGAFILVDASKGFASARHTVYHEYIHFLTISRDRYMPVWLGEGLAELFATVETDRKGRVKVGEVVPGRMSLLREERLMPMGRLFGVTRVSPEYNSGDHGQGLFYAQSWLLLHYLFQGPGALKPGALEALMQLTERKPFFSEEEFVEAVGVGYAEMETLLNRYVSQTRYTVRTVELEEVGERETVELREMLEEEVDFLMGSIRLSTRGPRDAYGAIVRAFEGLPESADAAAYRGYYAFARNDFDFAAKYFQLALDRGSESPATHLNLAFALMRARNPMNHLGPRRYDVETTQAVLSALRKARSRAGGFSPELYHRFGEALLGARIDADMDDFAVLREGMDLYPGDELIALYFALGLERNGELGSALSLVDTHLSNGVSGRLAHLFEAAKERIEKLQGELR